jgi:hypothetical protein
MERLLKVSHTDLKAALDSEKVEKKKATTGRRKKNAK